MKKTLLMLVGFTILTSLSSCKKEGCTDVNAENYDTKAKTNDGSCLYSEKLIVWQDQVSAADWDGIATVLKIYIDNQYAGSFSASEYFTAAPDCGSSGNLSKVIDLGNSTTKVVNIRVLDEDDFEWYNNNVTMNAGMCLTYEIQ